MPTYKAPVSDTLFLLSDVFDYAKYANSPGFSEAPIDVVEAVLAELPAQAVVDIQILLERDRVAREAARRILRNAC